MPHKMRFVPHHKPGARRYDLFMANFIGKIMAKVVGGLDALKVKHTSLVSQRDAAEVSLAKARTALQVYLLSDNDGDDRAVAALQTKVDSAASLLASLDTAIKTQGERVADAERQLADEQTKAARKMASEALALDVNSIESQLKPWLAATRQLAIALEKYGPFRFECGSISSFLGNAANEVEIAMGVSLPDLRGGVVAVAEGREKPPTPPAEVVKFVAPAPPPTETLFFLRHAKYTDASGAVKCLGKMREHALPPPLAKKALSSGAAIPLTDPRVRTLKGNWGMIVPGPDQCEALDGTPSGNAAPVIHSAFEPLGRGPPIIGAMRQPQTGTAMRSTDGGKGGRRS